MYQEKRKAKKKKKIIIVLSSILAVILLIGVAFGAYVGNYYHAENIDSYVQSSYLVTVESSDDMIVYKPQNPKVGLIFYQGGKVEYTAYSQLMNSLAQKGILCIVPNAKFNLPIIDQNMADGIKEKYPEIETWYIGGHSLGGLCAANYVSEHLDEYDGLILLAAYSTKDLSNSGLNVISIYGSEDGVLRMNEYKEDKANLPDNFKEYIIEGGCHGYFGNYGDQKGDGSPTIDRNTQISETTNYILKGMGLSK